MINPNNKNINNTRYIKKEIPEFIENISSVLKILRRNIMIKLVSQDLIADFYKINDLTYFNSFNFYFGNNKLIIEFNENNVCYALLILNPLDSIINNNKYLHSIAFKTLNHLKKDLYLDLLSKEIDLNFDILNNLKNNNIIITEFNELKILYSMYPIEENKIIQNNNLNFVIDNIFKIFIYIFYYEEYLSINKENSFNENESYFLINPKWLKDYKDFYNYKKLFELLTI